MAMDKEILIRPNFDAYDFKRLEYPNYRVERLISEAMHAFDNQYTLSDVCASEILDAVSVGKDRCIINGNERIPEIEIDIKKSKFDPETDGKFIEMYKDGSCHIEITLGFMTLAKNRDIAIAEVSSSVSHELMHTNIFKKRYEREQILNDKPADYENVVSAMRATSPSSNTGMFSRALYVSYYHEAQSFISQGWPETKRNMLEDPIVNYFGWTENQYFTMQVMKTDTFKTLSNNIKIYEKLSENNRLAENISKELGSFGISISPTNVLSTAKKIADKSEKWIRDLFNNAWYYYRLEVDKEEKK